jgi:diguanylate cyclase (GGDEF)-like protein
VDLNTLKVLTNDTIKAIRKFDIVTPELFKETFLIKAQEHNVAIDLDTLAEQTTDITLHKIYEIEKETRTNTQILKKNIDMATTAIDNEDKSMLAEVQKQMEALNRRIQILEKQIYLDELTKAFNRKWLFEKLLIDERFTKNGTIAFVDVDKFKRINDTYGHVTGDKVLIMLTHLLKHLENGHTIRYGGDEFLVIASDSDREQMDRELEKLCNKLNTKKFKYQGNTFKVHISYGVLAFKAGQHFQEVLEEVDQMMYHHKQTKDQDCAHRK